MNIEQNAEVKAAMQTAIVRLCKANRSGWGCADSMAVLRAGLEAAKLEAEKRETILEVITSYGLLNASAARQGFEKLELLQKGGGRERKKDSGASAELLAIAKAAAPQA